MLSSKHPREKEFLGVSMAIILAGAVLFTFGLIGYMYFDDVVNAGSEAKVIGGLIVVALGYILLELELIRTKRKSGD